MFAINPDGSPKWSYATGDINRSTVSIDDNGFVYVGSYDDNLYSFNTDGSLRFQFDTGGNPRYNGAVFSQDGTIYIGSQSNKMIAVTLEGNEIWNFEVGGDFNATPAIGSDGTIYVGNTDDNFYALNPDGSLKWSSEYGSWTACATAIGPNGTVYFSGEGNNLDPTAGGVLIAYDPDNGSELWRVSRSDKVSRGGPAISPDGVLYLVGEDGLLIAYDSANGTELWTYELNAGSLVTPAIDNEGNIYFGDESGFFYVISPEGERVWSTTSLGDRVWSSATIGNDGIIYVGADQGDETSKLFAIQTEATGPASSGWPMRAKNARHTGR
jgi:outer membrane protein assembly factor BamB